MLNAEGKITDVIIENIMNWPPALRAYASESATADSTSIAARPFGRTMNRDLKIWPATSHAAQPLALRVRASLPARASLWQAGFSQERMTYLATDQSANDVAKVIYQSK